MQLRLPTSRAVAPTCLFALAFLAARPFQDEPIVMGEGESSYEWVKGWGGELTDGGLGNTHGCVLVARDGRILANTDTENAVVIFNDASGFGSFKTSSHLPKRVSETRDTG